MRKSNITSVDQYIAEQPENVRPTLEQVRRAIREVLPDAEEVLAYGIPGYKVGEDRVVQFAAWKRHYSLYGATRGVATAFKDDLAPYKIDKGTIQFPFGAPVPTELIERIVRFRAKEVAARS